MRERGDLAEAEGRRAALDRMRNTKNRVDELQIGRSCIQAQQRLLHLPDGLEALLVEGIVKLCQIDRHELHPEIRQQRIDVLLAADGVTLINSRHHRTGAGWLLAATAASGAL